MTMVRRGQDADRRELTTFKMVVEYDGSRFSGWQYQTHARTVAGELLQALEGAGLDVRELGGSGRTDSGVHALAQVAHLRCMPPMPEGMRDLEALRQALNGSLPPQIHVLVLESAAPSFHARHGALSRSYLYQIALRRTSFFRRWVWWVPEILHPELMEETARLFAGFHDFRSFCHRPEELDSTLVDVDSVELVRHGDLLLVRLVASHFLWRMVRRVVGTLVEVGKGSLSPAQVRRLVEGEEVPDVNPSRWTAPPRALFLERVSYPGGPPLSAPEPVTPMAAESSGGS